MLGNVESQANWIWETDLGWWGWRLWRNTSGVTESERPLLFVVFNNLSLTLLGFLDWQKLTWSLDLSIDWNWHRKLLKRCGGTRRSCLWVRFNRDSGGVWSRISYLRMLPSSRQNWNSIQVIYVIYFSFNVAMFLQDHGVYIFLFFMWNCF